MREYFIAISIVLAYFIVVYSHSKLDKKEYYIDYTLDKNNKKNIKSSVILNKDINQIKWGYLNTFYSGLVKEPLELLKEPLPLQAIPDVPLNDSEKTANECKKLFDITNLTIDNKKEVAENRRRFKDLDKDPIKPFFKYCDDKKLKYKKDVIDKLVKDCAIIALKLKQIYNRPRPYQLCYNYGYPIKYLRSKHSDTPSYPSSYALQSYVLGYVLGSKYSSHQKDIEKISNEISWSRVWSGNNFESDIECSKIIMYNLRNYLDTIEI